MYWMENYTIWIICEKVSVLSIYADGVQRWVKQ